MSLPERIERLTQALIKAETERDMALARETDLENEHANLAEIHSEDVARLTRERDAAVERGDALAEGNGRLREERDKALAERDAALAALAKDNAGFEEYERKYYLEMDDKEAATARIDRREKEWTRRYEELEAEGAAVRAQARALVEHFQSCDECSMCLAEHGGSIGDRLMDDKGRPL